jgi:hypothetical protein
MRNLCKPVVLSKCKQYRGPATCQKQNNFYSATFSFPNLTISVIKAPGLLTLSKIKKYAILDLPRLYSSSRRGSGLLKDFTDQQVPSLHLCIASPLFPHPS